MNGKCKCQSSARKEGVCDNNCTFSKINKINKPMQGMGILCLVVTNIIETILRNLLAVMTKPLKA